MTPSPITPRFISTLCTGTSQSDTWKPTRRPGARDLVEDFGIPPDVIDVSHDADGGRVESLREVAGLAQRRNAGALGGKRWVQGLDPEAYAALLSVRDQLGDAVRDHAARRRDVLIGRGPAYQDEDIGAERRGVVHGSPVVLDPRGTLRGGGRRKHTAAAQARDTDSGVADEAHSPLHARLGELVTPHGHVPHAVPRARVDGLAEAGALRRYLIQAEAGNRVHQANTRPMRSAARSRSARTPAASASRNSSVR